MTEDIRQLRWRQDGAGRFVARPQDAGPTYHIRPVSASARCGKSWRLTADGTNIADAESSVLRHVKHRACTHAAEHYPIQQPRRRAR